MDSVDVGGCWTPQDRARVLAEVKDELWRYVGRHARDMPSAVGLIANLTGLTPPALETLRHLHLLLSDEVAVFVDEALPDLLGRRWAMTARRLEVGRGPVRGPVAWGATMAARARSGGSDHGLYASTTAHKYLETPELYLLRNILNALEQAIDIARERFGELSAAGWSERVSRVADAARRHPALARFDTVADHGTARQDRPSACDPNSITPAILNACARSTRSSARALAAVYVYYQDLVVAPTSAALLRALERRVLVPLDDDLLYELWALLGAVAVLDEAGWSLRAAGLAGQDAVPFTYVSGDGRTTTRLYFGHTPSRWRARSRYRALFARYGLAGATRRPDLIVEARQGQRRRYLLVEVKRTRDAGYIADSIYKVLGYLADFAAVFEEQPDAQGLLLLWDMPASTARDTLRGHDADVAAMEVTVADVGTRGSDALILETHHTYRQALRLVIDRLAGQGL